MTPQWDNFFVSLVGASAALAGLVFVGISINLVKIMSAPTLPGRAFEALTALFEVLLVSILFLVPRQPALLQAMEVLVVAVAGWLAIGQGLVRAARNLDDTFRSTFAIRIALSQFATVPWLVAGAWMLLGLPGGLYWLVPGVVGCFALTFSDAWVLAIEINR